MTEPMSPSGNGVETRASLLPLKGFVIGVTADRRRAEQADLLERRGATVMHAPTLSTEYLGLDDNLRAATETLIATPPDFVVATTGIGVRAWMEAAQVWGLAEALTEALKGARILARGAKATAALQVAGLLAWAVPESERLDELVSLLRAELKPGDVVAFQHYGQRDAAVDALTAIGASVVDVPVYRYGQPADASPSAALVNAICAGQVDAVTFTSAPAVRNLVESAGDRRSDLLDAFNERGVVAACVGAVCGETATDMGIDAPVVPTRGRLGLLIRALTDTLQARRRELTCNGYPVVVQGRAVCVDGYAVLLAPGEQAVLDVLLQRPGVVMSKPAILRATQTEGEHALEATITRLRRRLGPAGPAIRAIRGRGYCIDVAPLSA